MDEENRNLPQNDLDFNLMLTDSVWGKREVGEELKNKLNKIYLDRDEKGNPVMVKDKEGNTVPLGEKYSMWSLLSFFTRDMRLGNLSEWSGELQACRYMIELSNDLLVTDMKTSFSVALSRVATILETSQSKNGFLRRSMNTLRQEHIRQEVEAPKKSFFGGGADKKNAGGGY